MQGAVDKLAGPADFFAALQRAFLCLADAEAASSFGGGGPGASAVAALGRSVDAERLTVARALAAVYSAHAAAIGTVPRAPTAALFLFVLVAACSTGNC